ncbi:MAG: DNA polymerase III subunit beta [Firmicutes bacterium]|nr:DNA polymerase III subunit beta [Bacillota bacterium]
MKLTCDGIELAEAIGIVGRAVGAKSMNPILEGIKLTAKDGQLIIAATDLEVYIQRTICANIESEGTTVVPGKIFGDYVAKLKESVVELALLKGDHMTIKHGDNVGDFQCMLAIEYPDIVNIDKKPHFSIKSEALRDFIAKTRVSVGQDDSRPVLKGVLCEIAGKRLTGVSLDGFRLSKINKTINNHADDLKVIIPGRSLEEIRKLVGDDNGEVSIIIDNKFFQVNINKTMFAGRLVDGDYINYAQIIPDSFTTNVVVEKSAFEFAVERAGLLVRSDKVNLVTVDASDKTVAITSNNEIGKISEKVAAKIEGRDIKISFNAKYLYDVLKAINDEFIKISFGTELSPCIIESAKNGDYFFLVLPVRMS